MNLDEFSQFFHHSVKCHKIIAKMFKMESVYFDADDHTRIDRSFSSISEKFIQVINEKYAVRVVIYYNDGSASQADGTDARDWLSVSNMCIRAYREQGFAVAPFQFHERGPTVWRKMWVWLKSKTTKKYYKRL